MTSSGAKIYSDWRDKILLTHDNKSGFIVEIV